MNKDLLRGTDPVISHMLDCDDAIDRGLPCPDCGQGWIPQPGKFRGLELRHELECPQRRGYVLGNLGRVCGMLLYSMGNFSRFVDDPITHSYGVADEFCSLINSTTAKEVNHILTRSGFTAHGLLHEVDRRCGERFTYFSGLNHILDFVDEY